MTVGLAQAQLSIEITGAGANRIPVAIVDFPGDPVASRVITGTVRADLERKVLLVTHDEAFARDVEVERELTLPPRERANRGVEACVARSGLSGSGSSAPPSIYFYECGERVLSFS